MMDFNKLKEILPADEQNINRLLYLKNNASKPRIAVFGKYNHGKSTLLNALIGQKIFKVADKRETVVNNELEQETVIWIDTPGLDADVHGQDDKAAIQGAFEIADFLFLVHQAQAGELDKYEMQIFLQLARQDKNYNRKMFLILTQIDQKSSEEVTEVERKIHQQLSQNLDLQQLKVIPVSAQRYVRGMQENKSVFCEKSGMKVLFSLTETLVGSIDELRVKEMKRLKTKLLIDFSEEKKALNSEIQALSSIADKELRSFTRDVENLAEVLV
jgi:GTPase